MSNSNKAINITLWVFQVLLAIMFAGTGFMKMFRPIAVLSAIFPWTGQVLPFVVRGLGLIDVLGGLGLILPGLLRIRPRLIFTTAIANILLMICAIVFHVARGEASLIGFNIIVIFILAFISWGRSKRLPIAAR